MHVSTVLLIVAAAFLGSSTTLSTEAGADHRLLRSHKTHHAAAVAAEDEEERGWFDRLPEQFKRMKKEPSFLNQTFHNWRSAYRSVDDAVAFPRPQRERHPAFRGVVQGVPQDAQILLDAVEMASFF
ncbi:hypothetical protein PHYSODRAFT_288650 [Phytophthora sojae]|uniref:RxLR effector protein n=2 Tax=Phytophthora sojae TaxID=67593 RepID=G5A6F3_PHYSP|nr:hypothetical protein PHYSODRAFT_288650 [Phytophthora sojae]AEK81111.1 Avh289 [Phytophthora sojae]AEK81112.1 Avh289 [Phytophthora sojae]AEK81113.1 Avh289 [Phytophthora sojae]EGZ08908.1 hypothetical protein PHYSODRAFT_288650 [Phytophthora sojae]|eukprot:XP_009535541.1 hypothetical protein PHYSODRAFT_288650 [Phytophthora sojae]